MQKCLWPLIREPGSSQFLGYFVGKIGVGFVVVAFFQVLYHLVDLIPFIKTPLGHICWNCRNTKSSDKTNCSKVILCN
ncbi:hypothetical protein SAMN04487946_101580 [Halobellus clavatus]|uniref:Uncharacterized protein n=1 Tax=Halobellus clavatus TaxID=660517 RepID=A0A1H3DHF9_9EURY|nr:hypothetical protein SAMN04487946_101580 [Halobellus clavatus]